MYRLRILLLSLIMVFIVNAQGIFVEPEIYNGTVMDSMRWKGITSADILTIRYDSIDDDFDIYSPTGTTITLTGVDVVETDPIWLADSVDYLLKTAIDSEANLYTLLADVVKFYEVGDDISADETDPIWLADSVDYLLKTAIDSEANLETLLGVAMTSTTEFEVHSNGTGGDHTWIDQDLRIAYSPTWDTLISINAIQMDTTVNGSTQTGEIKWNTTDGTMDIGLYNGVVMQLGQELPFLVKNESGSQIDDGTVCMYAGSVGASGKMKVVPLVADGSTEGAYVLGMATQNIPDNGWGYIVSMGRVRGVPTDGAGVSESWSANDVLYANPSYNGGLTKVEPEAPNLKIALAIVSVVHASNGELIFRTNTGHALATSQDVEISSVADNQFIQYNSTNSRWENSTASHTELADIGTYYTHTSIESFLQFFQGAFLEHFDALVTSDGATVTMSLEQSGSGDLTMITSAGLVDLDCTSPLQTIALTVGSDVSPTENYIYIPQSTGVLTKSTTGWATTEHIKVGYFVVPSAGFVESHGAYVNQNWNDGMQNDGQGHMTHMAERSRFLGAVYKSGINGNGTDGYLTPTASNVELITTAGVVMQMHKHTVPVFSTVLDSSVLVKNWNGNAYHDITNLFDIVADSDGDALSNNKYFNLVLWGVANKGGEFEPMMINLPSGQYTILTNAINDIDGYDDFTIPDLFDNHSSTGYLIARITIQMGTTWSVESTLDLRGTTPQSASGGASGTTINFADNTFTIYDESDVSKIIAFQASGISASTARTLTVPDSNGTIALLANIATRQPLESTLTDIADGTINEDLNNTAYPWASDEIVSTVIHESELSGLETDPVYIADPAFSITSQDLTDIQNLSNTNSGDQDLSGLLLKTAFGDSVLEYIDDTVYNATSWDANLDGATKNAIRDKIESLAGGHDAVSLGTANGLSLSTQELSLALASTSTTGALSDTDWDIFNNKVGTETDPVYIADPAFSITSQDLTDIQNLSNTNSGDQTSIVGITGTSAQFNTANTDGSFAFSGGVFHDGFSDFVANEHIDWTASNGTIHIGNYLESQWTTTGSDIYYNTGAVGIGTASPVSPLEVEAGYTTTGAVFSLGTKETSVEGNDKLGQIDFYAPLEASGSDALLIGASMWTLAEASFNTTRNATSLVFATGASEVATEAMRINSLHNIGLSAVVPASRLDVRGDVDEGILTVSTPQVELTGEEKLGQINFQAPLEASGGDAILAGASIWAISTGTFNVTSNPTSLVLGTGLSEAATGKVYITSGGNVGIGTATPLSKLSIDGGLHVGGDSDAGDNNLLVDGTGIILGPLTHGSPSFSVYQADTSQSGLLTSTYNKLRWDLKDSGADWNDTGFAIGAGGSGGATNSRWTPGVQGLYHFDCSVWLNAGGHADEQLFAIILYINGVKKHENAIKYSGTGNFQSPMLSTTVFMDSNDYAEIYIWQASGSTQRTISSSEVTLLQNYTWWQGYKVQ